MSDPGEGLVEGWRVRQVGGDQRHAVRGVQQPLSQPKLLKTNTQLSTLVRIRFANYSKFVYTVLCLLYAVYNVSVVIPSQYQ